MLTFPLTLFQFIIPSLMIIRNAWSQPDATEFYVRGPNYMNDKVKVLSQEGAYNLLGVDLLLTDTKVSNS